MIARELRGEDVLAPASQIRFVRVSAKPIAGSTLAESGIFEQTGCRVIAVDDGSGVTAKPIRSANSVATSGSFSRERKAVRTYFSRLGTPDDETLD